MTRSPQRAKRNAQVLAAFIVILAICALGLSWGCGHTIRRDVMDGRSADFDFRSFDCEPPNAQATGDANASATPADSDLLVRYLGVSGVYFEWQGVGVLSAPFFSHQNLLRVATGKGRIDNEAIDRGMQGVPNGRAVAILLGHAHHDHLFDVPQVARLHPKAVVYANRTGINLLAAEGELAARTQALNDQLGAWIRLRDAEGNPLPVRLMALPSPHAKQGPLFRWAPGSQRTPATKELRSLPLRSMKAGTPLAFVLDFLSPDNDEVVARVYLQDAATEGLGLSPTEQYPQLADHPFDLAVLCIASHHLAKGFPEELISDLEPRHVLVSHYRDFFRPPHKPIRFAPLLTNGKANDFLERVGAAVDVLDRPQLEWTAPSCGPSATSWTMPVPGELLQLKTQ